MFVLFPDQIWFQEETERLKINFSEAKIFVLFFYNEKK